jgi:hypothetical protein
MRRLFTTVLGSWVMVTAVGCGSGEDLQGPSQPAVTDGGTGGSSGSGGSAGAAGQGGGTGGEAGSTPEDASAPDASGPTAQQACSHLGQVLCGRIDACARLLMDVWYPDAASCADILSRECVESLTLPDTIKTPAWTDECATALQGWACQDLLTRKTPPACIPPQGPRPEGSPCGEDGQCATGYCGSGLDEACGHCRPKSAENGACGKDDDCQPGLACNPKAVCVPYGVEDSACDADHPCESWLSCTRVGTNQNACKPAAGAGQQCSSPSPGQNPGCNLVDEYFCTGITHVCQKLKLAGTGDQCGIVGTDYVICSAASVCKQSGLSSTCVGPNGVGGSCDVTNGPLCEAGLKCVASKCVDPDLTTCN